MNLANFLEGVAIIKSFYNDQGGFHLGAEHDQIYLYATDKPMDDASVAKLIELGWFQDDAEDEDVYNPEGSWSVFV